MRREPELLKMCSSINACIVHEYRFSLDSLTQQIKEVDDSASDTDNYLVLSSKAAEEAFESVNNSIVGSADSASDAHLGIFCFQLKDS